MKKMNICVIGAGYVGLSNAVLLAQRHHVTIYDLSSERINLITNKVSPIHDEYIADYLTSKNLDLNAVSDWNDIKENQDLYIIATPTDYNPETNYFDTSSIEITLKSIIDTVIEAYVIIKSTIPIGYVERISKQFIKLKIAFSPEFLREGKALYDNLYPSRIVIGSAHPELNEYAELWREASIKEGVQVIFTKSTEAESIKLFANSYLAMRVAYFNELDSFAEVNVLNTRDIIQGIGDDPRIGDHYNNPSFGYGGYCFPKDTKQLRASFGSVPEDLISAIVSSNETRKKFILTQIIEKKPKTVGIYRLVMKTGSDNFRESAVISIMNGLKQKGINIIVYEPLLSSKDVTYELVSNFEEFIRISDLVVANRFDNKLEKYKYKTYTRDVFSRD
jgi:UDPglucose 6-dehydrogenase